MKNKKNYEITILYYVYYQVAATSETPPALLEVEYNGADRDEKPILLVAKGITFDSGGICLKECDELDKYKADTSGAAAAVAALKAAIVYELPVNIELVIPLCENMPSCTAMKCGDVVTAMDGKNIQISHPDNEGRLLLADALVYGRNKSEPKLIIDVASLTPGIRALLGTAASGVFCNSQILWSEVRKAGAITGDRVWRMPLWKFYKEMVTDYKAFDIDNVGHGGGSPCKAAAFLSEFTHCHDWIHFDITGSGMRCEDKISPYLTEGLMTGRPTRTLIQLFQQLPCVLKEEKKKYY